VQLIHRVELSQIWAVRNPRQNGCNQAKITKALPNLSRLDGASRTWESETSPRELEKKPIIQSK
jgi:hypothetical protein